MLFKLLNNLNELSSYLNKLRYIIIKSNIKIKKNATKIMNKIRKLYCELVSLNPNVKIIITPFGLNKGNEQFIKFLYPNKIKINNKEIIKYD